MSENKQNEIVYDVVLIGGGISSSTAAYTLRKQCKDFKMLVIEAKDRVGGRTQTIDIPSSKPNATSRWDIGGQWVTDSQLNMTKLLKELGLETYQQYNDGNKLLESNGKITMFNSAFPYTSIFSWLDMWMYMKRVDKDMHKINIMYPYEDAKFAQQLESQTLKEYLYSKAFTPTVRAIIRSNMSTCFGFELEQINALFGLMFLKSGGGSIEAIVLSDKNCAQEKRVKGGTQQICTKCLEFVENRSQQPEDFKLLLNSVVIEVKQNEFDETQPVEITTQNTVTGERCIFKARKVISSIPPNQYSHVTFKPEMPYVKRNLLKFYQVGSYMKYIVTYRTAFWREKGFSGQSTSDGSITWLNEEKFREHYKDTIEKLSFNRKMPTLGASAECWDGTNEYGEPALVGFLAGRNATEWADQSDELLKLEIIENLARLFGEEARDYVAFINKQWSNEPYSNGCPCYSVVTPGCMKDFARATREPFMNLHFCGTDTATEWQGYMDGAIQSGQRVANECLYAMYGNLGLRHVQIDYSKTYYHQRDLIRAIEDKQKKGKTGLKLYESFKDFSKFFIKLSLPLIGASSLVVIQFKYELPKFGFLKFSFGS